MANTAADRLRRLDIQHAVKVEALAKLAREIGIHEVLAKVATAIGRVNDETATPRELAAAARQAYRAQILAEMAELERRGKGRAAASIVAKEHRVDAHDPIELETLTNKYRRWLREEKRARARLAPLK
jgi:hypothetical protein